MSPFGFSSDDSDGDNSNNPEDFNAMMRQMQEQIQEQLEKLGVNPAGFINPLAAFTSGSQEVLPQTVVRDIAKKFVSAHGSQPIGVKDVTVVNNSFEIADIWLNEATVFPATPPSTSPQAVSRADWVDATLKGWQSTMEPLATGLTTAISALLDEAMSSQDSDSAEQQIAPIGAIASLLRSFIGSMLATQLGQAIGAISANATGAHDVGLPLLDHVGARAHGVAVLLGEEIGQVGVARQAEVHQLGLVVCVEEDVAGLDIAVNEPARVRRRKPGRGHGRG